MRAGRLRGWQQGQLRLYVEKNHVVTKPRYSERILSVPVGPSSYGGYSVLFQLPRNNKQSWLLKTEIGPFSSLFFTKKRHMLEKHQLEEFGLFLIWLGSGRGEAMCSTRFALPYTLALLQLQPKGSWEGRFAFHFPMCHCLFLAFP